MSAYDRACAASIEVQVPNAEIFPGQGQVPRAPGENGSGQSIGGAVRHLQAFPETPDLHESEHGPEDLLLCDPMLRPNVAEDRERHGVTPFTGHGTLYKELSFLLADFDGALNFLRCCFVDHGSHERAR